MTLLNNVIGIHSSRFLNRGVHFFGIINLVSSYARTQLAAKTVKYYAIRHYKFLFSLDWWLLLQFLKIFITPGPFQSLILTICWNNYSFWTGSVEATLRLSQDPYTASEISSQEAAEPASVSALLYVFRIKWILRELPLIAEDVTYIWPIRNAENNSK